MKLAKGKGCVVACSCGRDANQSEVQFRASICKYGNIHYYIQFHSIQCQINSNEHSENTMGLKEYLSSSGWAVCQKNCWEPLLNEQCMSLAHQSGYNLTPASSFRMIAYEYTIMSKCETLCPCLPGMPLATWAVLMYVARCRGCP